MAEPELVPITQQQYEQAVTALAGMTVDHWRCHDERHRPPALSSPDITAAKPLSWSDGLGVNPSYSDPQPAEE